MTKVFLGEYLEPIADLLSQSTGTMGLLFARLTREERIGINSGLNDSDNSGGDEDEDE